MITILVLLGGLLIVVAAVKIASWWHNRTAKVSGPTQPEELMRYSKELLRKIENPNATARSIERERQGGLSEQSVRIMLGTLEQVSQESTELKFTGRAKKTRANKGN